MTSSQTFDLSGRLVLVTGATRGIGRAVAIGAAAAGAELIITGRTTGALEEVDDAIRQTGGTATIVEMDMKDYPCLLYTSPSPRDGLLSRMPSSA